MDKVKSDNHITSNYWNKKEIHGRKRNRKIEGKLWVTWGITWVTATMKTSRTLWVRVTPNHKKTSKPPPTSPHDLFSLLSHVSTPHMCALYIYFLIKFPTKIILIFFNKRNLFSLKYTVTWKYRFLFYTCS